MAYIDTKYLGKCETCRNHRIGGCNTYCDHGEEYSPNLFKIPVADVVPKSEVDRVYYNLQAVLEERAETKREIAREIFEDIEKLHLHITNEFDLRRYTELKKKYTEGEK